MGEECGWSLLLEAWDRGLHMHVDTCTCMWTHVHAFEHMYMHMGSSEFEKLKEYPRAGWTGSDCSIDESLLPDNLGFPHGDACDSSLYACASVTVNTENIFQSDNFACKVAVSSRWCFTSICVGFVRVAVKYWRDVRGFVV